MMLPPAARKSSHVERNVAKPYHTKLRDTRAAADADHLRSGTPDARAGLYAVGRTPKSSPGQRRPMSCSSGFPALEPGPHVLHWIVNLPPTREPPRG